MILYSGYYEGGFPFTDLFKQVVGIKNPRSLLPGSGILILWGGEDISPSLYEERAGSFTTADDKPSHRDSIEVSLAQEAIDIGMPVIGICRGAQLMCAVLGGKVIQDVSNHTRSHNMVTYDGKVMVTSSLHHQMLYPWKVDHQLLAWTPQLSPTHLDGDDYQYKFPPEARDEAGQVKEPEIVYFPKTHVLAIQGHPEFGRMEDEYVQYCRQLVVERLFPHVG